MAQGGSISEVFSDLGHNIRRSGLYMGAKSAIEMVAVELSGGAAALASGMTALLTGGGASLGAVVALGSITGLSASLAQMDHLHQRDKILDSYKDELAAKLKKPVGKVSADDLETLANTNRTVAEELQKSRKQRNFGIVLSVVASLAAFTFVTLAFAAAPESLGMFLAKGLTGLMTYNAVKAPLHWVGDKLFGLDKETTHEHILSLKRELDNGKHITREQVFSVFLDANPELEALIARDYGAEFGKLKAVQPEKAKEAMERIGQLINLEQLTDNINQGKVNVTELAFAVDGQISGVRRDGPVEKPKPMLERMLAKCRNVVQSLTGGKKDKAPLPAPMDDLPEPAAAARAQAAPAQQLVYADPAHQAPARPLFAERFARAPDEAKLTNVERLMRQTAQAQKDVELGNNVTR